MASSILAGSAHYIRGILVSTVLNAFWEPGPESGSNPECSTPHQRMTRSFLNSVVGFDSLVWLAWPISLRVERETFNLLVGVQFSDGLLCPISLTARIPDSQSGGEGSIPSWDTIIGFSL
jgi:hypothetical protein